MPELVALFSVGALLSLITGSLFAFLQMARYRSAAYQFVQGNLAKIGLRWNELEGGPGPYDDGLNRRELRRARTTYTVFTLIAVLLSWLGFVFLLLMWVSLRKLVKSRLESELFASELARGDLPAVTVTENWELLKTYE